MKEDRAANDRGLLAPPPIATTANMSLLLVSANPILEREPTSGIEHVWAQVGFGQVLPSRPAGRHVCC
jgi:hypothetical protein